MREKPVQQHRVDKYIKFLNDVKDNSGPDNIYSAQLSEIVAYSTINKSIVKALTHLKLIEIKSKISWVWIAGEPDKQMALEILDYLLHLKKKTQHTPLLPDFATSIDGLNKATEAMVKATDNLHLAIGKVISGGHKNTPMLNRALQQADMSETIFSEHERNIRDRVYLAGQIASAFYSEFANSIEKNYSKGNKYIITIVDDLIEQLNAK